MHRASEGNRYMIYYRWVVALREGTLGKRKNRERQGTNIRAWPKAVGSFGKRKNLRGGELPKRI